jgi:HEPN domain-containing protein
MSDESVEAWLAKADEDYGAALDLVRKRKHLRTDVICFLAQQSAEKYLKAFLVRHKVEFRKTHDLRELRIECSKIDDAFAVLADTLLTLNFYAVDFRYPGATATEAEAREAVAAMKQVRVFVRKRLGLR